jgi:hypothetical protein
MRADRLRTKKQTMSDFIGGKAQGNPLKNFFFPLRHQNSPSVLNICINRERLHIRLLIYYLIVPTVQFRPIIETGTVSLECFS